ncbi:tRNA (guanine-N(1)-)-methyltransferase [Acrasis kona]|uniref:tRNA (Guanine-N(1)-)-methyltransferase n=1 Tax=Acrasis kona TaxID=1008807 RepID=A0AAW2YYV9_9EUKA
MSRTVQFFSDVTIINTNVTVPPLVLLEEHDIIKTQVLSQQTRLGMLRGLQRVRNKGYPIIPAHTLIHSLESLGGHLYCSCTGVAYVLQYLMRFAPSLHTISFLNAAYKKQTNLSQFDITSSIETSVYYKSTQVENVVQYILDKKLIANYADDLIKTAVARGAILTGDLDYIHLVIKMFQIAIPSIEIEKSIQAQTTSIMNAARNGHLDGNVLKKFILSSSTHEQLKLIETVFCYHLTDPQLCTNIALKVIDLKDAIFGIDDETHQSLMHLATKYELPIILNRLSCDKDPNEILEFLLQACDESWNYTLQRIIKSTKNDYLLIQFIRLAGKRIYPFLDRIINLAFELQHAEVICFILTEWHLPQLTSEDRLDQQIINSCKRIYEMFIKRACEGDLKMLRLVVKGHYDINNKILFLNKIFSELVRERAQCSWYQVSKGASVRSAIMFVCEMLLVIDEQDFMANYDLYKSFRDDFTAGWLLQKKIEKGDFDYLKDFTKNNGVRVLCRTDSRWSGLMIRKYTLAINALDRLSITQRATQPAHNIVVKKEEKDLIVPEQQMLCDLLEFIVEDVQHNGVLNDKSMIQLSFDVVCKLKKCGDPTIKERANVLFDKFLDL